jgi:lipoate-protein ligase A
MKHSWRLLYTGNNTAAMNMAIDEVLLRQQGEEALPTLRFYGWTRPSFSFGYFQKIAEAVDLPKCQQRGIDLVRRPTGGGTVIHGWDLTYSVAVPLDNPLIPKDTLGSYRLISEGIITGLRQLGIKAEHYSERANSDDMLRNICLTNPTKYDVLIDGKKVAGAAQRRKQGIMLHQGYIALDMPPDDVTNLIATQDDLSQVVTTSSIAINAIHQSQLEKTKLAHAIASGFEATLNIGLIAAELKTMEIDMAAHLAKTKYETDKWNFKVSET